MKGLPPSFDYLLGLTIERFGALIQPGRREPSPMSAPATPDAWAAAGGLTDRPPHEVIRDRYPFTLDCTPYDPATVSHVALQRLCARAEVDRVGGLPIQYRAGRRGRRRGRRRSR